MHQKYLGNLRKKQKKWNNITSIKYATSLGNTDRYVRRSRSCFRAFKCSNKSILVNIEEEEIKYVPSSILLYVSIMFNSLSFDSECDLVSNL